MKKLAIALLASVLLVGAAAAQEYNNHVIKFAHTSGKGTPPVAGMELFADLVKERSGGKIEVKLFPGGVLGGDAQVLSSLQGGVVEMMAWDGGQLARTVSDFDILNFPFMFNDTAVADALLDGVVGQKLIAQLPEHGLVGLAFWESGFRHLTNNVRPVHTVDDIAGLKTRTMQIPLALEMWSGLGANPVPMAFTELYTALETGTIDAQENPAALIAASKFNEVQKYLSLTKHVYSPQMVLIGKPMWDKLNDDERKLIADAAFEVRIQQREISRAAEKKALEALTAQGMQINALDEGQAEIIREKLRPVILKFAEAIDPAIVSEVFSAVGFDAAK